MNMMVKFNAEELKQMYSKAKVAFQKCIKDPENEFLKSEIDIPLNSITTKEEYINIKYEKNDSYRYIIKIKIQLMSPENKVIGNYTYYENEDGVSVDDSLVFK